MATSSADPGGPAAGHESIYFAPLDSTSLGEREAGIVDAATCFQRNAYRRVSVRPKVQL